MDTPPATTTYKNHRFPVELISHAVWLYFRFCLSFRDREELLFERGVIVTYEAIRKWCRKFGQQYANQLRRRPRPGDKWHMDEVFLTIKSERHYLWRAVDQDGQVLDILVQRRRDKRAAIRWSGSLDSPTLTVFFITIDSLPIKAVDAANHPRLSQDDVRPLRQRLPATDVPQSVLRWVSLQARCHPVPLLLAIRSDYT